MRLREMLTEFQSGFHQDTIEARSATDTEILGAHTQGYLHELIQNSPKNSDLIKLDEDTVYSEGSFDAAKYAAGAGCMAVDRILLNAGKNFFCIIRPPGHHAFSDRSMGFCILNNVAICAAYALTKPEFQKVAVLDFDVHHGNGTQDIIQNRIGERCFFASIQQEKIWPYNDEDQINNQHIYNIGMPEKASASDWMTGFRTLIEKTEDFSPDLLVISAGFDAHKDDPPKDKLFNDPPGRQMLTDKDYYHIGQTLAATAKRTCGGRIISYLEGGYNVPVLSKAAAAYVRGLNQSR